MGSLINIIKGKRDDTPLWDDDILDEDGLEGHEIRAGGGLRKDENGDEYWLKLDHLREFNRMDTTIKEDKEFWDWFRNAREAWGLKPRTRRSYGRGHVDATSYGFGAGAGKGYKYLNDYWGGSSYFGKAYSGSGSRERVKLAVGLQAVQTTIRVIDDHDRRMSVRFATQDEEGGEVRRDPKSYTDYEGRVIVVSPMALLDDKIDEGEGIDVTHGLALHEASHAKYSEATLKDIRQPTMLYPVAVTSLLHNVLEDVRIEALTAENFPGFAGYFDKTLGYLWDVMEPNVPQEWGPEIGKKLNAVIAACKWRPQFEAHLDKQKPSPKIEELRDHIAWWHAWVTRYQDGTTPLRKSLVEGLERLREDSKPEMDEMEKADRSMAADRMNVNDLRGHIERMLKEKGVTMKPCDSSWGAAGGGIKDPTGRRKPGIGTGDEQEVNRMAKWEIEEGRIRDFHIPDADGAGNPTMVVLHPTESDASREESRKGLRQGIVSRMRNAFAFRPSAMEWSTKLQRGGTVDEDEMWRAGIGDYRVFEQKHVESTPDTAVTLLVDISGSMRGWTDDYTSKLTQAAELATIMLTCLKDIKGVSVRVRAHTGDTGDNPRGPVIYKIWDRGDPMSRVGLIKTMNNGNNYDGFAIGWCARELMTVQADQRVIIVLSDGYPAGTRYGGEPAMDHVKKTTRWAAQRGVQSVQIAIDEAMDAARQSQMFDNWVPFESAEKLPAQLTAVLTRIMPNR